MTALGFFTFMAFVALAAGFTKMCYQCPGLSDPQSCRHVHKCHPDESCYTDVFYVNGEYFAYKGCKKTKDCPSLIVVGKRAPVDKNHQLVCEDCCGTNGCNNQGCDQYFQTSTMFTSTPSPSSAVVSQAPGGLCRDHEEDGFSCTVYDRYNFCTETDTASLSYSIAHNKCPKHCGFCSTTAIQIATTEQSGQCRDHEEDGFRCADYDQYNFCTDVSSIAYLFAHQKCPKHCGFCQTQNGGMTSYVSLTSTHRTTAAPWGFTPQFANVVVSQVQTSTGKPCSDFEDSTFSCASWASNGFCQSPTGVLHEITVLRCSKYCGLC